MIKIIPVSQLTLGMHVHDLNCGWLDHPFARNHFAIEDEATLNRLRESGIAGVFVDTDKSVVVTVPEKVAEPARDAREPACEPSSFAPEVVAGLSSVGKFNRVKNLCASANHLMQDVMRDVRQGEQVDIEKCEPVVDNILDVMFSFPSAMLPLAQVKSRDEYTFQHSVSVASLAVAFGRVLGLPRDEIRELSLGGLLHDVGKAKVPGRILNKPGKLDEAEFTVMKSHVVSTAELLGNVKGISEIALNAAAQHHERYDGTGYPSGLKGDEISLYGQMLAIVDVYDAITSIRVYHNGMPPTEALRKLFEWGGSHFNPRLVEAFIKGVGIYPAGSLVRMESDRLGIVREVMPDRLLQPVVQIIFDCKKSKHISPETVDLSSSEDRIKSHESFEKWGIDQARWATAHI
ncbi:MAG: phosphodiesterase [Gallionellales bacterium GWA2_59_43]|nr:MAG: phosphodiesterase [Gallionellales bacterium GWA2_59_43]